MAKNIIIEWFLWQFVETPKFLLHVFSNYLAFTQNFFSLPLLFKTLVSPWRRYNWQYPKNFDIYQISLTFTSNIFSRFLGFLLRIVLIITGALFYCLVSILFTAIIIFWITMPFFIVGGLWLSLTEFFPETFLFSVLIFSLVFSFIFFNVLLFFKYKIKRPTITIRPYQVEDPKQYNIAQLLSLEAAKIVEYSERLSRKRGMTNNSSVLLYVAFRKGKKIKILCQRLGFDMDKFERDLKNYLEKIPKDGYKKGEISKDLENALLFAFKSSSRRKEDNIGEEEIFAGLAEYNEFLSHLFLEYDLKKEDVQNLALWVDTVQAQVQQRKQFWEYSNLSKYGSMGKDLAFGYTITLDRFSKDWRREVAGLFLKEVIGHEKEIEETEMILARSRLANALIVGDPGVGRKSIVEAIAKRCYLSQSLPELNGKRVVELDMVKLSSQVQDFEKLELILDQIFSEALNAGNVILTIDELHHFINQGSEKAGQPDIAGILSKYLAIPTFQFIGITSYEGLHRNIERDSAFLELFKKVEVKEISKEETVNVLMSYALEAEYRRKVFILYPTIVDCVNLTERYMPNLHFPKKALDVLEDVIILAKKKKSNIVFPEYVANVVAEKTEIPVGKIAGAEKETLMNLENLIHQRIVNQAEAVQQISNSMRRARAGISSKKRPMGSFLFLGPTGVGKTETAKALAEIYFGKESNMVRIDMSEFQAIADIPRLLGAISPVEMEGILTTQVRENPFALVLLDEVEKAHPNILNLFLQVLDEGHVTDGQSRKVMFTNTIIIATSNAGADHIFKAVEQEKLVVKDGLLKMLFDKNIFRPEFINRFDAIVLFHPLTKENLLDIANLNLQSIQKELKKKEINLQVSDELKEKIVNLSYKPEFGARQMRRVIQDTVENSIAKAIIAKVIKKGDTIEVDPENFELIKL